MKTDKTKAWYKQHPWFTPGLSNTIYYSRVFFQDPDHVCDKEYKYKPDFYYINGTDKVSVPKNDSDLDKNPLDYRKIVCL
uniref:Uncharacterized protein n=1 Tax=Strigamia maritima TaxID=126957 RepID=T1ISJ7_STRMM